MAKEQKHPIIANPRPYLIGNKKPNKVSVSAQKGKPGRLLVTAAVEVEEELCSTYSLMDMVQIYVPTTAKRITDKALSDAIEVALPTLRAKVEAAHGVTF
jgi:hypothetical protein